ncbi:biotin--[acetyl-CoA-carboxylase] ligase [Enterococcus sp. LJL99]
MTTKSQVLTLLIQEMGHYISGEEMAQQLSLSRNAIWKAINELRKEGHVIISMKHKGYCYEASDVLCAEGIKLDLAETTPELSITVLEQSESTMKDAKIAALDGQPSNSLIIADMQEAPRGRFGRPFFSKPGCGIYMSMLLRPNKNFAEMAQYTVIMAVAVSKAMDELANVATEIKWVNDIYINGKKVCGILSEAMAGFESGQVANVVIGMGINFSLKQKDFPKELQQKASSLFPTGKPTITRNQLIASIWNHFYQLVDAPSETYLDAYREKSFVLGKTVAFTQAGKDYEGIAVAIDDYGELIVKLSDNTEKKLSSGEISLSKIEDKTNN